MKATMIAIEMYIKVDSTIDLVDKLNEIATKIKDGHVDGPGWEVHDTTNLTKKHEKR